ncbi:MAG TPA: amidohydrolase family protein [Thermoanaerobaculia bacterium]
MTNAVFFAAVIAFRGATLIDGTGSPPRRNSLVVISDGRVISIGEATAEALAALPRGVKVIDCSGKWIIPGLIDAHVHAESDDDLKTMLRWGVTSVRLMSEDVAAATRLAAESRARADIPEVFPAAPIFTAKGGWWDQGEPPDSNLNRFPATPQESREAVRMAKATGSREIKLMLDDMAWCRSPRPALPRMAPDVAKALIAEAASLGLRAVVHAPNLADAKEAISDGATALAHGVLEPIDARTVAVMKTRPVFYIPTMDIFEFLADTRAFVQEVLSDPLAVRGLPQETVTRYRSAAYSRGYRERYPNFANVSKRLPALRENLRRLDEAGVPVALGTDMWAFPGLGVSIEMDCYVRSGITPLEVIRIATQNSARSLGIEADRGTLEPGKRADLLVLDADPLARIENMRSIDEVYKGGNPSEQSKK